MSSLAKDKVFIDGMRFTAPHEKAPSFVKGQISVNAEKFIPFLEQNVDERGWLNADLKESKSGNLYLELNTYRKGQNKTKEDKPKYEKYVPAKVELPEEELEITEELPF